MKKLSYFLLACVLVVMTACSDNSYLNAIPSDSTMLISMNTAKLSGAGSATVLRAMLRVSNMDQTGIDLASPVYCFEDVQGNLGFCARVDDRSKLKQTLEQKGLAVLDKRGYDFAVLPNHWMLGSSDHAVLLVGPVAPGAEYKTEALMAKYLGASEEEGITGTPMFTKLDSISAPMAMVCQAQALPEKFVAPFTLGAPKNADPSQVCIAAGMEVKDGCLLIEGKTFSFNPRVNEALQQAAKVYRPISGQYVRTMSRHDAVGIFLNVEGTKFLELMRRNQGLKTMLAGINAAIDMDNIIKSIDGDMAIISPMLGDTGLRMSMAAQLKNTNWLADVDYWKQSVPAGGHIGDWGRDCYFYRGGQTAYYFGVSPDMQYMSGDSEAAALQSVKAAKEPLSVTVQDRIKGQKIVMVINCESLQGTKADAITGMLKPMFGQLNTIIYTFK